MKNVARLSMVVCLVFIALAKGTASATSAPDFKLTLSPIYENLVLKPGEVSNQNVEISNQGPQPIFYSLYPTPYGVTNENYDPSFIALPGKPNIAKWFNLSIKNGVLLPGKSYTVPYSINVPADTPAGGYYAAIFAQSSPNSIQQKGNQIQTTYRVGELFYISVAGKTISSGKVASWTANVLQSNQLNTTLRLENSGSIHFLSRIHVEFKSILGSDNFVSNLTKFVLPQTIRKVDISWKNPPPFGLYRVNGTTTTIDTQKLANRYILIVSTSIRIKAAIALGLVILIVLLEASFSTIIRRIGRLWDRLRK